MPEAAAIVEAIGATDYFIPADDLQAAMTICYQHAIPAIWFIETGQKLASGRLVYSVRAKGRQNE